MANSSSSSVRERYTLVADYPICDRIVKFGTYTVPVIGLRKKDGVNEVGLRNRRDGLGGVWRAWGRAERPYSHSLQAPPFPSLC